MGSQKTLIYKNRWQNCHLFGHRLQSAGLQYRTKPLVFYETHVGYNWFFINKHNICDNFKFTVGLSLM